MSTQTLSTHETSMARRAYQGLVFVLTFALVLGWLTTANSPSAEAAVVTGQAKAVEDGPFSAQELSTVQVNGVVWDQAIIGNTVYVAGDFSSARPAGAPLGQRETPRANLLAYDITTGVMIDSWAPSANAQVKAIEASADGESLYIGGSFTELNGQVVSRMAKISASDGTQDTRFRSNPVATVNSIAVAANDTVYYGGVFGQVGWTTRTRVAAVDANTGALRPFAPNVVGGAVWSVTVDNSSGDVYIGGAFTSVNGSNNPGYGMARLQGTDGSIKPWSVNSVVRNGGVNGAITSLKIRDGVVYGNGYMYSRNGNNFEGTFAADAATGSMIWLNDCHGDSYDNVPVGNTVYVSNHAHDCSTLGEWDDTKSYRYTLAMTTEATGTLLADNNGYWNFAGQPSPTLRSWEPTFIAGTYTNSNQASWNVESNGDYLIYGGEFMSVNGRQQQGIVRFPAKKQSDTYPPFLQGSALNLSATPNSRGGIDLSWQGSWDRDSRNLTYELIRNGDEANPIDVQSANSTSWFIPNFSYRDLSAEGANSYQVKVRDPNGVSVRSSTVSATSSGAVGDLDSQYGQEVMKGSPRDYWRMGDPARSRTGYNVVRDNNLSHNSAVTAGATGALAEDSDLATSYANPGLFSSAGSTSAKAEPGPQEFTTELWFKSSSTRGGQLIGYGNRNSGNSSSTDRKIMMDSNGTLVAGVFPGNVRKLTSPQAYNDGQWHHVATTLSADGYAMYVDGERVAYDAATTSAQAYNGYWRVGGDVVTGWGMRSSNAWFNGDLDEVAIYPQALSGETIARHYVAGTDPGQLEEEEQPEPNQAPQAVMSLAIEDLTVSADGQGSTDADGDVASHSWDFGDGTVASGATAQHTYTEAGTYTVTLTVTDDKGDTATSTESITVVAPDVVEEPQVFVEDNFTRNVDGGLGAADIGGDWVVTYRDAALDVEDGAMTAEFSRAGVSSAAYLIPSTTSTDLRSSVALDKLPNGGGTFISMQGRRVGNSDYRLTARVLSNGNAVVSLIRANGSQTTTLATQQINDLRLAANERLAMRLVVDGTSPTTLKAKVWKYGQSEPTDWMLNAEDTHDALQTAGSVGYMVYMSGSVTSLPLTFLMDSFVASSYVDETDAEQMRENSMPEPEDAGAEAEADAQPVDEAAAAEAEAAPQPADGAAAADEEAAP